MLVPFVLPFLIAASVVLVVGSLVVIISWRRGSHLGETVLLTAFLGIAAMLPLTIAVKSYVDSLRYRVFRCATPADIADPYVEVPPTAVNITYGKQPMGHSAQFTVTEPELEAWLQTLRDQGYPFDRTSDSNGQSLARQIFLSHFGVYKWKYRPDFKEFAGPRASDGAGFTVWHSASTNTAVLKAGYW